MASVKELSDDAELIITTNKSTDANFSEKSKTDLESIYILDSLKYSFFMLEYYKSKDDNEFSDWYNETYVFEQIEPCLIPKSSLLFPVRFTNKKFKEIDWIGKDITRCYFWKVTESNFEPVSFPFMSFRLVSFDE